MNTQDSEGFPNEGGGSFPNLDVDAVDGCWGDLLPLGVPRDDFSCGPKTGVGDTSQTLSLSRAVGNCSDGFCLGGLCFLTSPLLTFGSGKGAEGSGVIPCSRQMPRRFPRRELCLLAGSHWESVGEMESGAELQGTGDVDIGTW